MLTQYMKDAIDLVNDILNNSESFAEFLYNPNDETWCDIDQNALEANFNCEMWSGASKGVFVVDDLPYVIKIPFVCYNEEVDMDINYCELETYYSSEFYRRGLGDYIAKEVYCGVVSGCPIYIQERAICNCGRNHEFLHDCWLRMHQDQDYDANDHDSDYEFDFDSDVPNSEKILVALSDQYGADIAEKVYDLINELSITDLHTGNFGFINGRFVLVDYSGYGDESAYSYAQLCGEEI